MNSKERKLQDIQYQLRRNIRTLESICDGLRSNFNGIGEKACINSIERKLKEYRRALKIIETITLK